jgi:hypothetical protein
MPISAATHFREKPMRRNGAPAADTASTANTASPALADCNSFYCTVSVTAPELVT